jgi:hypothetical protein
VIDQGELSLMIGKMLRGPRARAVGQEATPGGLAGGKIERRPWVLHPFLIGIFPIVSLYAHNVYESPASAMALPMAVMLSLTFVVWLVFRFFSGDASRAGLAVSLLVVAIFGYKSANEAFGVVWYHISWFWVYHDLVYSSLIVLAMLAVAYGAGLFVIFRRLGHPAWWTRPLNIFTMILVAMPTFSAVSARWREPAATPRDAGPATASKRGWTPDIYFIVLDGYARGDVMKELFGFDNGPFLDRLERRGFFVARQSHSNYCQTRLSLASTLNADYLDNLVDLSSPDLLPVAERIKDNLVRKSLAPLGYKFVTFATGFEATDFFDSDFYLSPRPGNPEFSQILLEMTPVDAWFSEVRHNDRYSTLRDRTQFVLDKLPSIARMKAPTFTFAHILSPHPPFVFGEHGEDVSPRRIFHHGVYRSLDRTNFGSTEYVREAYRAQSAYLTEQVEQTIEKLLAESPEPPVIILQSDHGSWLRYHPDDAEATDLRERFGILNCIYMPGHKVEGLSDHMTSVNTFRAVLKDVIGADLPLLPERNEFSPFHNPLVFTDVTERLHSPVESRRTFTYPSMYHGLEQQF